MLRVLFVGDVYGRPGRRVLAAHLPALRGRADFIIVNGENAAGGFGLNRESFELIVAAGADAVTLGNHAWHHREIYGLIDDPRLIRPLNLPLGTPGRGWRTFEVGGERLTVVNLLGRVFMEAVHNPFLAVDDLLKQPEQGKPGPSESGLDASELGASGLAESGPDRAELGSVFVDFHAEATSEKAALGWHLDGRVAAVIGTHTHVPTADGRILPLGTAFQTDAGFTGPMHSIIGADPAGPLQKFVTERPHRFGVREGPAELNGVWVDIEGGRAVRIERYHYEEGSGAG